MTKTEVRAVIKNVLGSAVGSLTFLDPVKITVQLDVECSISWPQMKALAERLGTENIRLSLDYEADYSELTPGNGPDNWLYIVMSSPVEG